MSFCFALAVPLEPGQVVGVSGEPGCALVGVGAGVGPGACGWATTTPGARTGACVDAGATGPGVGVGATAGDGSTAGDGATTGDPAGVDVGGSAVGSVVGGGALGVAVPGSCDDGGVGSGTVVVAVGADETNAMPGVGPPAVVGGDCKPTNPMLIATAARTRLMTPRARTSRSR